jgi:hypothetical protein
VVVSYPDLSEQYATSSHGTNHHGLPLYRLVNLQGGRAGNAVGKLTPILIRGVQTLQGTRVISLIKISLTIWRTITIWMKTKNKSYGTITHTTWSAVGEYEHSTDTTMYVIRSGINGALTRITLTGKDGVRLWATLRLGGDY